MRQCKIISHANFDEKSVAIGSNSVAFRPGSMLVAAKLHERDFPDKFNRMRIWLKGRLKT
jgi:hypothetical protein